MKHPCVSQGCMGFMGQIDSSSNHIRFEVRALRREEEVHTCTHGCTHVCMEIQKEGSLAGAPGLLDISPWLRVQESVWETARGNVHGSLRDLDHAPRIFLMLAHLA
jgi:hypothetical protein